MDKDKSKKEINALVLEELKKIKLLQTELSECVGESPILRRAKGSILHDFYNACERVFELIANKINGGMPEGRNWYKRILDQMTVDIEGIRPPVISKKTRSQS